MSMITIPIPHYDNFGQNTISQSHHTTCVDTLSCFHYHTIAIYSSGHYTQDMTRKLRDANTTTYCTTYIQYWFFPLISHGLIAKFPAIDCDRTQQTFNHVIPHTPYATYKHTTHTSRIPYQIKHTMSHIPHYTLYHHISIPHIQHIPPYHTHGATHHMHSYLTQMLNVQESQKTWRLYTLYHTWMYHTHHTTHTLPCTHRGSITPLKSDTIWTGQTSSFLATIRLYTKSGTFSPIHYTVYHRYYTTHTSDHICHTIHTIPHTPYAYHIKHTSQIHYTLYHTYHITHIIPHTPHHTHHITNAMHPTTKLQQNHELSPLPSHHPSTLIPRYITYPSPQ